MTTPPSSGRKGVTVLLEQMLLFPAHTQGYATYRIPALAVTTKGTVLAFCAARMAPGDWSHINIALRRSVDGGITWEAQRIIAGDGAHTVDNATPIVDRSTGVVHLLYQVDYARCCCIYSEDDGRTFKAPVDITPTFEQFRPEYDWHVLAPGPGHGIQLRNGRLLAPVWLSTGSAEHRHKPSVVAVVYSDDHGQTWQRGDIVVRHSAATPNPSETTALQVQDGRIMLSIRNEAPCYRRLVAYGADGAHGWTAPVFAADLFDPVCCASLLRLSEQPSARNRILFANPDSRANPHVFPNKARWRENLTIRLSYDEGQTWPTAKTLEPGIAGYCDLAVGPVGDIYCLYESAYDRMELFKSTHLVFAHFDLDWLTDGQDA